jgi:hypothetical protein
LWQKNLFYFSTVWICEWAKPFQIVLLQIYYVICRLTIVATFMRKLFFLYSIYLYIYIFLLNSIVILMYFIFLLQSNVISTTVGFIMKFFVVPLLNSEFFSTFIISYVSARPFFLCDTVRYDTLQKHFVIQINEKACFHTSVCGTMHYVTLRVCLITDRFTDKTEAGVVVIQ